MAGIIGWVLAHVGDVCTVVCGVVFASSLIVALTPSVKDDAFLGKVIGFLDHLSVAKTADDRKLIEEAKGRLK